MNNNRHSYIKIGPISTSEIEIRDLFKAWAAISLAFAILFSKGGIGQGLANTFMYSFMISGLTVGIGFIFHELAHKIVAQYYGCFAEFRSDDRMLIFAVLISFLGFVIAAPGAVIISGPVGRRRNGIISAAGPAMNLLLAVVFLLGILFIGNNLIFVYGFSINTILGLFNLIPFGIFDGKKVLDWNKPVYSAMVGAGILLLVIQSFI